MKRIFSEEHRKNISKATKGKPKEKISILRKGKTWEELYGVEESKRMKQLLSDRSKNKVSYLKGKTYEDVYGAEKTEIILQKRKLKLQGRKCSDEQKNKISKN